VLLLDPTIKAGVPLWYGYRNWEETPGMAEPTPAGPPRDSLYNDFIYWAKRPGAFRTARSNNSASNTHIPIQALLHIICAEWLTIADYIKTRLGQIEWEISFPEDFLDKHSDIDVALKKLHVWRRLVPLYREELNETLQRVFRFPCHSANLISGGNGFNQCQCALQQSAPVKAGSISAFRDDFTRALSYMEEYQQRIDRLTSVVTAIISIKDSRRSQQDNRNVARLTWLATFFIPLSFVATLFSMQSDVTLLEDTYKWYFAAALPLATLSLGLALLLNLPPGVQLWASQVKKRLGISSDKKNR
jgi:Mg2+ and Co2+ transporter CorA